MPSGSLFTGLLEGFNTSSRANRALAAKEREDALARDEKILTTLASHDDPEIAARAAEGLMNLSIGKYEPGGKGIAKFLGSRGPTNPDLAGIMSTLARINQTHAAGQAQVDATEADTVEAHPGAAAMAPPPETGAGPQAGQLTPPPPALGAAPQSSPALTPSPSARPGLGIPSPVVTKATPLQIDNAGGPVPTGASANVTLPPLPQGGEAAPAPRGPAGQTAGAQPGAQQVNGPAVGGMPPPPPIPTSWATSPRPQRQDTMATRLFPTAEERTRRAAVGRYQGEVEGQVAGLVTAGFTPEQAREIVKQDMLGRASSSGSQYQSIAGQMPNGTPAYGILDRATGTYIDPNTRQPLIGFQPRTTTGSTSMGADREAIARADYGKPYAQLTQPQQQAVLQREIALNAGQTSANTNARMQAEAAGPISSDQREVLTTTLSNDWQKINAPYKTMLSQYQMMLTGLDRLKADPNGASQIIITAFNQALQPLNAVREGEYARTILSTGIVDRLQGMIEKAINSGSGVPEQDLRAIVSTAGQLVADLTPLQNQERDRITQRALGAGINPTRVIAENPTVGPKTAGAPPPGVGAGAAPPPPVTVGAPGNLPKGTFVGTPYTGPVGTTPDGRKFGRDESGKVFFLIEQGGQRYLGQPYTAP